MASSFLQEGITMLDHHPWEHGTFYPFSKGEQLTCQMQLMGKFASVFHFQQLLQLHCFYNKFSNTKFGMPCEEEDDDGSEVVIGEKQNVLKMLHPQPQVSDATQTARMAPT